MASLSRELAHWVVGLRYDDLPPAVDDRAEVVQVSGTAGWLKGPLLLRFRGSFSRLLLTLALANPKM